MNFELWTMNCKHSLLAIIATIMLASCSHKQEATQFEADSTGIDSTALRIAVMPALNCLPVYYAEKTGLADSLGVEIRLLRYQAQMDIDTAIADQTRAVELFNGTEFLSEAKQTLAFYRSVKAMTANP